MSSNLSRICLVLGLLGLAVECSAQSKDAPSASPAKVSRDASAIALKADASLQKPATVEATDLPLGEVLQELSRQSDAALRAMPKIEDQRVTLHLTAQPLYQVMTRLCGLLSHSPSAPRGYFWTKESQGKDPHPHYLLQRDLRSITEEQDALDIPHQKAIRLLRDWRDLARMSVEQRKRYRGDLPEGYVDAPSHRLFQDALTDASDSQIETLVQSGSIPVNTTLFADKIATFNKAWHDRQGDFRQRELQSGHPDPFPDGVPDAPPDPPTVSFAVEDENGEQPELAVIFGLKLNGVQTADAPSGGSASMHVTLSPLHKPHPPFPDTAAPGEPVIDLSPLLTAPEVTVEQKGDVGFTLQTLAKASGISLYQEEFYKTVFRGGRSRGLRVMKGTVPQLLNAICAEWDYDAKKVDEDYVLWSNTWALDRTFDIPERFIAHWRSRYERQKGFTLDDRIEIATALTTWGQLFLTLKMRIPEAGPWNMRRDAEDLRFLGNFSAAERAVLERDGMAIADMSPQQQAALLGRMRSRGGAPSPDEVSRCRFFLQPDPRFQTEGHRITHLEVRSDGDKVLWLMSVEYQTVKEKSGAP